MNNKFPKQIFAALILGVGIILLVVIVNKSGSNSSELATISQPRTNVGETLGLKIEDLVKGTGQEILDGTAVTVHYTGKLTNGTVFDSSYDRGAPFQFPIGFGQVIQCWDQGLIGKNVGDKLRLTCPPDQAYGESGAGPIPPNSTLIFEIEIINTEGIQYIQQ